MSQDERERWIELSIETPAEYVEPLTEIFHRHGEGGVAIEQSGGFNPDEGEQPPNEDRVTVKTYVPDDHTLEQPQEQQHYYTLGLDVKKTID